jgi:hypothetical protein
MRIQHSDAATGGFTATGSLNNTNPMLEPGGLENNGGPTQTISLLLGALPLMRYRWRTALISNLDRSTPINAAPFVPVRCGIGAYESESLAGQKDCEGKTMSALVRHFGGHLRGGSNRLPRRVRSDDRNLRKPARKVHAGIHSRPIRLIRNGNHLGSVPAIAAHLVKIWNSPFATLLRKPQNKLSPFRYKGISGKAEPMGTRTSKLDSLATSRRFICAILW